MQDPMSPAPPTDSDAFDAAFADQQTDAQQAQDHSDTEERNVAASLGQRLRGEFERRKSQRVEIERRWLRDIRQYNAQYEPEFEAFLKERKSACKVFVPITRRVCNIVEARWADLLFPTDDRNFVVEASPMPELDDAAAIVGKADPAQPLGIDGQQVQPGAVRAAIADVIDEAKRKAANMQRVVDDQLAESDWPGEARRAIHDAVKLGSGVVKGPFAIAKTCKRWTVVDGQPALVVEQEVKPAIKYVDAWNFYPSLSVADCRDSDGFFERVPLTKLQFAKLAEQPGFDRAAIARTLAIGEQQWRDANIEATREAVGTVGVDDKRFNVVEFNGHVDVADLIACGLDIPDTDESRLLVFGAIVWFTESTGEVLKAALSPLTTDHVPYSVVNWQRDTACVFGYGVPHELRDVQESANSAYRAAHDNLALSVGPQIVVNSKKITPMNGSFGIEPLKVWDLNDSSMPVSNVFGFYQIDTKLTELFGLFNLSRQLADEIGGPMLAMQGQDAPSYVQTATGMSIAYNAANVWMRRAVKLWDDQVTVQRVRAFVDWNLEHSQDPDIKGDCDVLARGTSALLEAEGQVQRLALLAQQSASLGIPLRKSVNQLRSMALAMRLDPDELLPSDDEVKQMEQFAAQNRPPNPEQERIEIRKAELLDRQQEREFSAQIANQANQLRLAELASRERITVDQARVKYQLDMVKLQQGDTLARHRLDRQTQMFNAELATKARIGSGI